MAAVDAVVITWNRWELSRRCIEHLLASSVDVHVIVVDNGSVDGTPDRVREQFPQVELIEFAENRGYGVAANAGAEAATSEFVAIVNSDALVAPDYFELVLGRLRQDAKLGWAAGLSINPADGRVDSGGAVFDRGLRWGPVLSGADPGAAVVDETTLASPPTDAPVYRRSAFLDVGAFDPEIFAYGEDLDLVLRLWGGGWRPASVAGATVEHVGAASLGKRTVAQMKLVAWGRGYVAGRYRLGLLSLALDLPMWLAISLVVRSPQPLKRFVAGLRRGRSLPAREIPAELPTESWLGSTRRRHAASKG